MIGNFLLLFIIIKIILVYYRRKISFYAFDKIVEGDYFIAIVAIAIGGYITNYTYFGHNFELLIMILGYIIIYWWLIKKKIRSQDIRKPAHLILIVAFAAFARKVIWPAIYGMYI